MTTSWSFNGRVCLYCMVPMCGNVAASTVMVRLVPSASGRPGQDGAAATAACGSSTATDCVSANAGEEVADQRDRESPASPLTSITPRNANSNIQSPGQD